MRLPAAVMSLLCALPAAGAASAAGAPPRPHADRAVLEAAVGGVRLHVELVQAPRAVRGVRVQAAGAPLPLLAIRRDGPRTVWHSRLVAGAGADRLRAAASVRVELQAGGRRVVRRLPLRALRPGTPPPAARAPTGVAVSTDPALAPAFGAGATDHVVRCAGSPSVRVSVTAPREATVAVTGQAPRSGAWETTVALEPGRRFTITAGGVTHHIRCLPADFPAIAVEHHGPPAAGHLLVTPARVGDGRSYAVVLDGAGTPVWWMAAPRGALDLKALADGTLVWSRFSGSPVGLDPDGAYEQHRLDGSLVHVIRTVGVPTDHHDLQPLANGDVLLVAYRERAGADLTPWSGPSPATVLDPVVQEIAPDGSVAWEWDGRDHVGLAESARFLGLYAIAAAIPGSAGGPPRFDTTHINSVEPDGDGVLVSLRHADAVYRIDRATGAVDWKLGGTPTAQSLTIVGDPHAATRFGGQHDARRQPDGSVTLFDNGTGRDRPPQALRYRIDPIARTARLLDAAEDPLARASSCCGSARPLDGGGWAVAWGGTPRVTVTGPDGATVLALTLPGALGTYRAVPVPPGALDADALRTGMDAMAAAG